MSRPAPKINKALAKAMFQHRVNPTKVTASDIIKKFELGSHAAFYRKYYHAAQQAA